MLRPDILIGRVARKAVARAGQIEAAASSLRERLDGVINPGRVSIIDLHEGRVRVAPVELPTNPASSDHIKEQVGSNTVAQTRDYEVVLDPLGEQVDPFKYFGVDPVAARLELELRRKG